ncbi:hypothetical protein KSP40_PGU000560 [Platanthera guangdongensis]|uniref:Uncharacterized protein n=1 Tax=Platanthera guangdongensis TaxID=2320717 RepID=A0ABR2M2P6_9ASPA
MDNLSPPPSSMKTLVPNPPVIDLCNSSPPHYSSSPTVLHNNTPPASSKSLVPIPPLRILFLMEAPRDLFSLSPSLEQRSEGDDFALLFLQEVIPNSMSDQASQFTPRAEATPNSTPLSSMGKANLAGLKS